MDGSFFAILVFFFCICYLELFVAGSSFGYYVLKRKISEEEIIGLLDTLKSPLKDLFNAKEDSFFRSVYSVSILSFRQSGDMATAIGVRVFSITFCLLGVGLSLIGVFQVENSLQKIIAFVIVSIEIVIMVKAWRFGHTLGR